MTLEALSIAALVAIWISFAWIAYVVAVFPVIVQLLGGKRRATPRQAAPGVQPLVSVVIAVHNEQDEIEARLRNVLAAGLPKDRVELVVSSDGSTDRTDEICRNFDEAPVVLVRSILRRGKTPALDAAVQRSSGEILVFSDATTRFRPDTLALVAAAFADPTVGCVGGFVRYRDRRADGAGLHARFRRHEDRTRSAEAALGYVPSVSGAIHALRRGVYQPVAPEATRDLVDPAQAVAGGFRVVLLPDCLVDECGPSRASESARARVRMTLRGFASLPSVLGALAGARRWIAIWQLLSHKVLRWLLWIPLLLAILAHAWLATQDPTWASLWTIHAGLWLVSVAAACTAWLGSTSGLAQVAGYPVVQIGSMAYATLRWCLGGSAARWRPDRVRATP